MESVFSGNIRRLDYIRDLGCNAIWMNPCFESSFHDAGYDVTDYYQAAPRYGTNEDLKQLFDEVHRRGMHILLDLVPGHTSVESPWFKASCSLEENEYSNRYIWTNDMMWAKEKIPGINNWLFGISDRASAVAVNCFSTQPALNYGFGTVTAPWQFSADSEEAQKGRLILQDIMSFWLDLGCDGFRVDMAASLVKADPDHHYTKLLWQKVRAFLDENIRKQHLSPNGGIRRKHLKPVSTWTSCSTTVRHTTWISSARHRTSPKKVTAISVNSSRLIWSTTTAQTAKAFAASRQATTT